MAGQRAPRDPSVFGMLLRQHRICLGLTQEELAQLAGLSARGISDLERGISRYPLLHTVRHLAAALDLSPADRQKLQEASRAEEDAAGANSRVHYVGAAGAAEIEHGVDGDPMQHPLTSPAGYPPHPLPIGGFLGALPSGPLIGREQEIERLLKTMKAVETGEGRLVALAGEAGVGKTRLAQEISLMVQERGFAVVAGSCYEAQHATPYFPWLDLLTDLYRAATPDLRAMVPQRFPSLATLLPDQHLPLPVPAHQGVEDQERLFWSVVGFIQVCAEHRPLALLLDDLHWADRSSLHLLERLARQTRNFAILLLITYRDIEIGRQHLLQSTLHELTRQELVQRIAVRHLEVEGIARLVATVFNEQDISSEFASLLYERTEGNPFLVQQVLRVLVERGDVYRDEGRWTRKAIHDLEVPESIRSAVGQRVDRLSEGAQQILGEASLLGQTFLFEDLAQMGAHEELVIEEALDEVLRVGLIREVAGDRYAFDHALTQQVLYDELGTRKRRRLHLAAGRALEQLLERTRAQRFAELAWHFQHGDDPERALRYGMHAGEQAEAIYAYQDAERHYRTALDLAREMENRRSEATAGEQLASVLQHLNRWSEALSVGEDTLTIYHTLDDIEGEMRMLGVIVHISPPHHIDELIRRLECLRDRVPASPSPTQAQLLTAFAMAYFKGSRFEDAIQVAERALELATASGDHRAEQEAWHVIACAHEASGQAEEAVAGFERLAEVAEGLDNTFWLAVSLIHRGWLCHQSRDYEQAVRTTRQGLDIAQRSGSFTGIAWATINLGEIAFDAGEWREAERWFAQAVPLGSLPFNTTDPTANLLYLRLLQGDQETLPELECLADDPASWAARYLAEWELVTGHPARARDRLERALAAGVFQYFPWGWAILLAESIVHLDQPEQAEALLSPLGDQPSGGSYPADLIHCQRVMGMLRANQGRWDEAHILLQRALAESGGFPFVQAQVHHAFGLILQRQGRHEAAQAQFRIALTLFDRLGARVYAARTATALRSIPEQAV